MKNPFAFFLAVLAVALSMIALYSKNAEAVQNDTRIEVTLSPGFNMPNQIVCQGSEIDDMIAMCWEALKKMCPEGGRLSNMEETEPGVLPARIKFDVRCKGDDPAI
jgi:hypothetical protein